MVTDFNTKYFDLDIQRLISLKPMLEELCSNKSLQISDVEFFCN